MAEMVLSPLVVVVERHSDQVGQVRSVVQSVSPRVLKFSAGAIWEEKQDRILALASSTLHH